MARLHGIFGRPFVDLSPFVDTDAFPEIHEEITRGLVDAPSTYTGGTLKWMGVVAPWQVDDGYLDANEVLAGLNTKEFETFLALGDHAATEERTFGDETESPFTHRQMRWLELRHQVYFPWKTCLHFLENDTWDDKHSGKGKSFDPVLEELFPKTVQFIKELPFLEIGRAVLFGIAPNDHAPFHRDAEPGVALSVAQSINFVPGSGKQLVLASPDGADECPIDAPIYWFNDMDWHGVPAAPTFRYSIRVDGAFDHDFLRRVESACRDSRKRR